ncbi:hypothetical protein MBOU_52960 [Mycobacterium bourgelatii]|uniref:Uncharacterized protein n=1 Tax=Mycobacterium bourgelatii TaxID=1273442 RepID=A0A7I9YX06_MYCBU|nr:hypothetical protein MBOU_52960 [Mycobacterium bourgelatii]
MPVGTSGLGGSPPLTNTTSGLSTPPPQAATGATASTATTTVLKAARTARIRRMTATLGPGPGGASADTHRNGACQGPSLVAALLGEFEGDPLESPQ